MVVTRSSGRLANQGLNLEIRGATSVNGNVSPLIVIDGIVSSSESFMALNSDDIDNISVLKDGELLRYGAQSAGGVLLVTTKRGKVVKQRFHSPVIWLFNHHQTFLKDYLSIDEMNYMNGEKECGSGSEYKDDDRIMHVEEWSLFWILQIIFGELTTKKILLRKHCVTPIQ